MPANPRARRRPNYHTFQWGCTGFESPQFGGHKGELGVRVHQFLGKIRFQETIVPGRRVEFRSRACLTP